MSDELIAKLGDLITDVVAVRSCTAPDKTPWTKAQVMHYATAESMARLL